MPVEMNEPPESTDTNNDFTETVYVSTVFRNMTTPDIIRVGLALDQSNARTRT